MDVTTYYANKTGLPAVALFGPDGYAKLRSQGDAITVEKWDSTKIGLPEPTADELATILKQAYVDPTVIGAECAKRIYAVASDNAQKNMSVKAATGALGADDMAALKAGVKWIDDMRAACQSLIAASDPTYADDKHWPTCPPEAAALAARN